MNWKNILRISASALMTLVIAFAYVNGDQSEIEREVIVKFKPNIVRMPVGVDAAPLNEVSISSTDVLDVLSQYNPELILKGFPDYDPADSIAISPTGKRVRKPDFSEIYRIRLPEKDSRESLLNDLDTLSEVTYAELNGVAVPVSGVEPNDEYFNLQWGLRNTGQSGGTPGADISATEAWEVFTGDPSLKIGIIDWGVWSPHPDLTGKVSGDAAVYHGHGTHVAGIASAKTNNSIGVAGVDWNAQIIAKCIPECGSDFTCVANKIVAAVDQGANVINNSWRLLEGYSIAVRNAFAYAYKMNSVAVASMGNEYQEGNPINYPAAFGQGIIAVGATRDNDQRSPFSNTGEHIDVVAPGGINPYPYNDQHDILSTWVNEFMVSGYLYLAGTSMAAPHVSGLASLLKGYNPDLYNDDIEQIIKLSADDITYPPPAEPGWDCVTGMGRINAREAFDLLQAPHRLYHCQVSGSNYSVPAPLQHSETFYSVPGLEDGKEYWVRRWCVKQAQDFRYPFKSPPHVWGRGVGTVGFSKESPNFGMGYCEPEYVTTCDCHICTYVYEVWDGLAGPFIGWFPCYPSDCEFTYSVFGDSGWYTPSISIDLVQSQYDHQSHITWTDSCLIPDWTTYQLQVCDEVNPEWQNVDYLESDCHEYYYTPTIGSATYHFRIRSFTFLTDTSFSEWDEDSIVNVPNPPTNIQVVLHHVPGQCDNLLLARPVPPPPPPDCPTNLVYLSWDYPENQLYPVEQYDIWVQGGGYGGYHMGVEFDLNDILCLWPNDACAIWVVASARGLTSDSHANLTSFTTGQEFCEYYPPYYSPPAPGPEPTAYLGSPTAFSVGAFPNPFNASTQFRYSLPNECQVKLVIYNILGKKVITLIDRHQIAGSWNAIWDGKNEGGQDAPSGIYLYKLDAGNLHHTGKIALLK